MRKTAIALVVGASIAGIGNVSAASMEDRMMVMEKRLKYLEQRLAAQDKVIAEKEKQISELSGGSEGGGAWFSRVEIGGTLEVEASHTDAAGDQDSDIITPTVELGIAAQVNDWVSAELVLLYEEETDNVDGDGNGDINVDTAMVSIADPDSNWFINAGQYVVPFGTYSTHMVSDPVTLEYGETGDTAVEFGMGSGGLTAFVYALQGDMDDTNATYGAGLGYETETDSFGFVAHLGYLNQFHETDGIGGLGTINDDAGAWIASAEFTLGNVILIGEYLAATDSIPSAGNEEPAFYNVELGFNFNAAGMPATIAIGYQGTDDLTNGAWDPDGNNTANAAMEERILGALTFEVMDGTSIGLEYKTEETYAGDDTDTFTGLLGVEF